MRITLGVECELVDREGRIVASVPVPAVTLLLSAVAGIIAYGSLFVVLGG